MSHVGNCGDVAERAFQTEKSKSKVPDTGAGLDN